MPVQGNSELLRITQLVGAFGSIALSFGLLVLYGRQTKILEQQYQPHLSGEVESRSPVTTQFVVRNTGSDYAYGIEAEWTIADKTRTWEKSSLAPGATAAFPIVIGEDGRWKLQTQAVKDYLDENNASSEIEYEIRCKDQFDIPRSFSGSVNFDVITKREESNEIWDSDPLTSLATSAESIEASIDAIASDLDDRRDEQKWQNRWSKQQAVISIVQERGKIEIDVLSRMVKTSSSQLEYRLSELEEAGFLNYREETGVVIAEKSPGDNYTLSDFNED
ncbi:DUF1573 domain-containing protein [Natrinema pallidum]|uniref:DUF1573 domain-containing protein n=1 Tax=Natrinema pallidum TaxID=69527 RepID=A0A4P9TGC5_9EURY|nr:DUF1573 domain-containing protein [Natrinema pallidum]QCW02922.1 DUF1573 domain-containing protein [Natrinema pallidum]